MIVNIACLAVGVLIGWVACGTIVAREEAAAWNEGFRFGYAMGQSTGADAYPTDDDDEPDDEDFGAAVDPGLEAFKRNHPAPHSQT